jgi:filamentous hemagglutinin
MPPENRLPENFKTFDFFDDASRHATSVKTLDTTTASRVRDPGRVFSALRRHVNAAADFEAYELGPVDLSSANIASRSVRVGMPLETNDAQWAQIRRAMEYAKERGVRLTPEVVTNGSR